MFRIVTSRILRDTHSTDRIWHSSREHAERWAEFFHNRGYYVAIQEGVDGEIVPWTGLGDSDARTVSQNSPIAPWPSVTLTPRK